MRSVAIVGGSLAGLRAAETLRSDGFSGTIHFIGEETRLPYDRPPLSKEVLGDKMEVANAGLISQEAFDALHLELHLGKRAVGLDAERKAVLLAGGGEAGGSEASKAAGKAAEAGDVAASEGATASEEITADGIVIATGSRPRKMPGTEGIGGVYTLRTLEDCLALKAEFATGPKVAVIGAGFIGAEVAATARGLGLDVTVIEMLATPLARVLGDTLGQVMADLHRDNGVDLRLGVGVEEVVAGDGGRVSSVELSDGTSIAADVVVVGIGVIPNTEWLEGSGLEIDNGVVCDETLLAAPGITSAGDVARWPNRRFGETMRVEHWDNAIEQGIAAARRLLAGGWGQSGGGEAGSEVAGSSKSGSSSEAGSEEAGEAVPFTPVPWFWSDQYDRKIQLAGRSSPDGKVEIVTGSLEERRFAAIYERDGKLVGVLGMNRPRHVMQYRQLIVDGASWQEALAFGQG